MIVPFVNALHAVWLDPFSALDAANRARLNGVGIRLENVSTLADLAISLRRAHMLVIRLGESAELLQEVQMLAAQLGHSVPVVCRVDRRHMEVAVEAMRLGALHVIATDEWSEQAWRVAVEGLNAQDLNTESYVFVDPISQHLLALTQRVAQTDVTALLVGPTGAGKEVLARVLHESSSRAKGPFVALNCAAMPEHLIEDMLFGHEKGAFTGALKDHKGLFEQAHGGSIFLDEIGEMPMPLQAKLLRVLQEKKLNRLGGEITIDLDVRVIAATNKDLKLAIEQREFREDLYFRISTFRLRIQPLKDRPGDIMPLVMQSLARHIQCGAPFTVAPDAQAMLYGYSWPGNVRELENVVQRAVVLCGGRTIASAHLMFDDMAMDDVAQIPPRCALMVPPLQPLEPQQTAAAVNLEDAVKSSELQAILTAIQSTNSRNAAAAKLGISPRTLRYKLAQLRERGLGVST